jgi:uncharacterized membrane protein YedE/YeeE
MYEIVFMRPWPWWAAGPALGLVVTLMAWMAGRALGVSTAYGSVCAVASRMSFFSAKEYREGWRLWFVLGLPVGGLLAGLGSGTFVLTTAYGELDALTRGSLLAKAGVLFPGGLCVGWGARWAGGCPSGHSIVGIAQGARSSIVATVGFMAGGIAVFNLLYAVFGG